MQFISRWAFIAGCFLTSLSVQAAGTTLDALQAAGTTLDGLQAAGTTPDALQAVGTTLEALQAARPLPAVATAAATLTRLLTAGSPENSAATFDLTWLNGGNRQRQARLATKYVTASALLDVNYSYSFNNPIDDTLIGSTVIGRHNEVNVLLASLGGDFKYEHVHATLTTQLGSYSTLVPRNDFSTGKGQYDLAAAFRYIREAYAGYHWDLLSGFNLDAGIFMSYIGLFSYVNAENWGYQPSYVSDNTPFFFQGLRAQLFLTDYTKVELWVINGWQSYAMYNQQPGFGYQGQWRPREWLSLVTNGYLGHDTANAPGRIRLHSDNSISMRYYQSSASRGISKAAFSITADIGGESGDGVSFSGQPGAPAQNFIGAMAYHRIWLAQDLFGLTLGGGYITNPGRYLVLLPPGPDASQFDTSAGTSFKAWDVSATFDYMPSDMITFRLEGVYRATNVPYFAGHHGVTSPTGFNEATVPATFTPDYAKSETRLIAALMFRI